MCVQNRTIVPDKFSLFLSDFVHNIPILFALGIVENIKNNGTLDFMDDDDVVEISAVIGKDGAKPVKIDKVDNKHIISLMRVVKAYEKYTVEGAVTGNEQAVINGLLIHPLVGDWEKTTKCFEELKQAHKEFLPEFKF